MDNLNYGLCPTCREPGVSRERRPNGNDKCSNRHTYLSKDAIPATVLDELVRYKELDEFELDCHQVSGVQFRKDFGPWKKDEFVVILVLNLTERTLTEYDSSNRIVKYIGVTLNACP